MMLDHMGSQLCRRTNWVWTPQTYSHNYKFIFNEDSSFEIIEQDHAISHERNDLMFQAIIKVDSKKSYNDCK